MAKCVFQFTGLSGVGKSTLSLSVTANLTEKGYHVEILDGDELRKTISADLGFSEADRLTHLKRVARLAATIPADVVLIAVINPYEKGRQLFREMADARLIWLRCKLEILKERDTKGLYQRALLPNGHPQKITNLTGVNAPFEYPTTADLTIDTDQTNVSFCTQAIVRYIMDVLAEQQQQI